MTRRFWSLATISIMALGLSGIVYGANGQWGRRDNDHDDDDRQSAPVYRGANDSAYRDGLNQGRYDRSYNRRYNYKSSEWKHADSRYRDAYRAGYDAGYNNNYGRYRNDGRYRYPDNGPYGNGPYANGPYANGPYGNGPYSNGPYSNGPYPNGYPYPNSYPNNYPYGRNRGYGNGNWARQAYDQGFQDGVADGRNDRMTGHSFRPTHDDNYKHADRGYNSSYGDKNSYKQQYRSGYEPGYRQGYGR